MSDPQQHLFRCTDPDCPVVTFIDRIHQSLPVDRNSGACPDDHHDLHDTAFNVYIGPYLGEKTF